MNLKSRVVQLLDHAYRQEQIFVQILSDEERSAAGTPERWSAKDTIAHITAWKERAAQVLAALKGGEPAPAFDGPDPFNARIFTERQDLTWSVVLDQNWRAYRSLREGTQATPEDVLASPESSEGYNEPVWWFVVGVGCAHSLAHLADYYIGQGKAGFAITMQEQAADLLLQLDGGPHWQVYYGLACHYAAAGQPDEAITALREALRLNPGLVERSKQDPRLDSLREHPEYRRLDTR